MLFDHGNEGVSLSASNMSYNGLLKMNYLLRARILLDKYLATTLAITT
jgi:hypothetical protein